MKPCNHSIPLFLVIAAAFIGAVAAQAQTVIITFDQPWRTTGSDSFYDHYDADIMRFTINPRPPQQSTLYMTREGSVSLYPGNGTPFIEFQTSITLPDYVSFVLTSGSTFGLVSADLADPYVSQAPRSIVFNGFRPDGSMVTTSYTTPGGGSKAFQAFQFGSDFAFGLSRVEIPQGYSWAMDNLVVVPEPGTTGLIVAGIMAFAGLVKSKQRKCTKTTAT